MFRAADRGRRYDVNPVPKTPTFAQILVNTRGRSCSTSFGVPLTVRGQVFAKEPPDVPIASPCTTLYGTTEGNCCDLTRNHVQSLGFLAEIYLPRAALPAAQSLGISFEEPADGPM
jgi:hypothetical protein